MLSLVVSISLMARNSLRINKVVGKRHCIHATYGKKEDFVDYRFLISLIQTGDKSWLVIAQTQESDHTFSAVSTISIIV